MLGAPKFENAVIKRLASDLSQSIDKDVVIEEDKILLARPYVIQGRIDRIWAAAEFSPDQAMDLDLDKGEVFWGNKKRLLFLLDTAAWLGLDNSGVGDIIMAGGHQAVALHSRVMLVASGEITGPPWAAENIEKYLSDETEQTASSPGNRKSVGELAG